MYIFAVHGEGDPEALRGQDGPHDLLVHLVLVHGEDHVLALPRVVRRPLPRQADLGVGDGLAVPREFKDVVLEDAVFDDNRFDIDVTIKKKKIYNRVTKLLLSDTTSSNTTSLNSRAPDRRRLLRLQDAAAGGHEGDGGHRPLMLYYRCCVIVCYVNSIVYYIIV